MEEALAAYLLASVAVRALVVGRITWDERPQGRALPAITLQRVDGAEIYTDEGRAGLVQARVQVDCWATDADKISGSSTAKRLARAVEEALPVEFSQDGVEFQGCFVEDSRDFAPEIGPGDVKFYRRTLDLELWHKA